jgi:hypothetical protein
MPAGRAARALRGPGRACIRVSRRSAPGTWADCGSTRCGLRCSGDVRDARRLSAIAQAIGARGNMAGQVGHRILKASDVSPVAVACPPERSAAHGCQTRVHIRADDVIQHVLRNLLRMARPARPDTERGGTAPRTRTGFSGDTQPLRGSDEKIGHCQDHSIAPLEQSPPTRPAGKRVGWFARNGPVIRAARRLRASELCQPPGV